MAVASSSVGKMDSRVISNFSGRRVFITGHTGFKGSWLLAMLRHLGAEIHGYSLAPPTTPSLFDEAALSADCHDERADVSDLVSLRASMAQASPEIVFHLAAQPLVLSSMTEPVATFEVNSQGTVNVLEAIRTTPSVRAGVIITTDKCYAPAIHPLRETDPLGGEDPYSASKAAAELAVHAYRSSFFKNGPIIASARAGNVIGGGDWAQYRLLADLARAISTDRCVTLRHPHAIRPWQHVFDACVGYLQIGARALAGDRSVAAPWNFGPLDGGHLTVQEVVDTFVRAYGQDINVTVDASPAPENPVLRLDSRKARELLSWVPVYDMYAAIEATARWYRQRADGENVRALLFESVTDLFGRSGIAA